MPACITLFQGLFGYTTELEKRWLWKLWRLRAKQGVLCAFPGSVVILAAPSQPPHSPFGAPIPCLYIPPCSSHVSYPLPPAFHPSFSTHTHAFCLCSLLHISSKSTPFPFELPPRICLSFWPPLYKIPMFLAPCPAPQISVPSFPHPKS